MCIRDSLTVADLMYTVKFKLDCINPSITKPNTFSMALFNSAGSKLLYNEADIQTKEGSRLVRGSLIKCDKTCPRCRSLCTLTFQRKADTEFRTLLIVNDRLDFTTLVCQYLSLIHICRCRRYAVCRSRWSPYH
eukprot:TRINITY_DN21826_c0_g1_i1.p2 TRINITY_DN21826_c0_g1~~TRINITY_DN21826_c0_g1_i1.p2  ORF type:complete len:134 (-),score=4.25 TRINITY_DN21826_c0_g1_i1:10-411(-)